MRMGASARVLVFITGLLLLTGRRAALPPHTSPSHPTTDVSPKVPVTGEVYTETTADERDRTDLLGTTTDGLSKLSSTHPTTRYDDIEGYTDSTWSEQETSEGNTDSSGFEQVTSEGNTKRNDGSIVDGTAGKNCSSLVTTDGTLSCVNTTRGRKSESDSSVYEVLGPVGYATLNLGLSWAGLCAALLGTVLNSIAVLILTKMSASATNSYMTGLTVLDILYLLMTLVPFTFNVATSNAAFNNRFYVYYAKYVSSGLMPSTRRTIICVTTTLCLERLIAVALPLRAVKSRLIRNPKTFMFITFIVVMTSNVHNLFKTYIADTIDPRTNMTKIKMSRTTLYEENETIFVIAGYLISALFVYIPLITIVICNVWLVVALHRHSAVRSSYKTEDQPRQFYVLERQTAILIITYTVLFVLLALPYSLHGVVQGLVPAFSMQGAQLYLFLGMQRLYGFLDVLSSSMNFPVYLARSSDFRVQLRALLRLRPGPRHQGTAPGSTRSTATGNSNQG